MARLQIHPARFKLVLSDSALIFIAVAEDYFLDWSLLI